DGSYGLPDAILELYNNQMHNASNPMRLSNIADSLAEIEKGKGVAEPDMSVMMDRAVKIQEQERDRSPRNLKILCKVNDFETRYFPGPLNQLHREGTAFVVQAGQRLPGQSSKGSDATGDLKPGWTIVGLGHFSAPFIKNYDGPTNQLAI